jgi:hypothetical protein
MMTDGPEQLMTATYDPADNKLRMRAVSQQPEQQQPEQQQPEQQQPEQQQPEQQQPEQQQPEQQQPEQQQLMTATYDPADNKLRMRAVSRLPKELYLRVKAAFDGTGVRAVLLTIRGPS